MPDRKVEEFKKRREQRLNQRLKATCGETNEAGEAFKARRAKRLDERSLKLDDEEWKTIKGTHVMVSDNGKVVKGPERLKSLPEKKPKAEEKSPVSQTGKTSSSKSPIQRSRSDKKHRESDGSEYKGEPAEVVSGKNGNLKPKSEASKRIDTSDAIDETRRYKESNGKDGIPKNSLSDHVDENGNLSPERQRVHDEIVQKFFADKIPYDGKATMTMSGGGPASGKSFIEKSVRKQFGDDTTITVDPDKIKAMLPGYTDMAIESDKAAGFYHEESSAIAKRIYQYCLDNNINCVYDGTGDGSVGSVKKKIDAARKAGYTVRGEYVTVDTEEAVKRNLQRYQHALDAYEKGESDVPPRLPKEKLVRETHAKVADIQLQVATLFDEFVLTDNNVARGETRPVLAKCTHGGELKVEPGMEERMQRCINKGTSGARIVNGRIVMPNNGK